MAKKQPETPYEPSILGDEEFAEALDDAQSHRQDIKTLEERKAQIDADIIATLFSRGDVKLAAAQGTWAIENKITRTIDKGKLVAFGVDPQVIEDATTEHASSPYLKLYPTRAPKPEKE